MPGPAAWPAARSRLKARLGSLLAHLRQAARWASPVGDPAYAAEVRNEQNLLLARTSCLFALFGSSSVAVLGGHDVSQQRMVAALLIRDISP